MTRLRILRELAERRSIAATADVLWLTPSAVSQQIAALEGEVRRQLVEKAGRGVKLTAAGQLLAKMSGPVFEALEAAAASLDALADEPVGTLRIASFPSVVQRVLPAVVASLQELHPQLTVEVEDLEGEQSLDALRVGRVDVAIIDDLGWDTGARREALEVTELFEDQLVVVFPVGHTFATENVVPWSALANVDLIAEQRSSLFARTVDAECRRAGFEPRVTARVHDTAAMLAFVAFGTSITVLPELAVTGDHTTRIDWRPLDPPVVRRLLAARRQGSIPSQAERALIKSLVAFDPDRNSRVAVPKDS